MPVLIEGAGVPLACEERGEGAPVLLVHDIAADAAGLAPLGRALAAAGARAIAYDRRGYGASGAPEPYQATTVHEQAEDAAAVLRALAGRPALVAGIGLGALIALDLAVRHGGLVRAAVLADPPLFAFVLEAGEALAAERAALEDALRAGGPQAAVERWLGAEAEAERVQRARAAHAAVFADLAGRATWPVTRGRLRSLDLPAVVMTGPGSPPHVIAAADAVAGLMPRARRAADGDVFAAARSLL